MRDAECLMLTYYISKRLVFTREVPFEIFVLLHPIMGGAIYNPKIPTLSLNAFPASFGILAIDRNVPYLKIDISAI
jgi:hypothetical protein